MAFDGLYIWRIPTLLGAMACSALVLFAAAVVLSVVTRGRNSVASKVVAFAVLGVLAVAAALVLRAIAASIARELGISFIYVAPGPPSYGGAVLYAAFAFAVGQRTLQGKWTGWRALLFYAWLLAFTAANVINYCAPGWCEIIGFPFPWRHWSDQLLEFGDSWTQFVTDAVGQGLKLVAATVDLVTFTAVAHLLQHLRIARRGG